MNFPTALDPIRSIKAVLRAAGASPGPLLAWWFGGLGALFVVYLVIYLPVSIVMAVGGAAHDGPPPVWVFVLLGAAMLTLVVLMFVIQSLWIIGLETLLFDVLRTGTCSFERAWRQRRRFGVMLRATLIVFAIALAAELPMFLGVLGVVALSKDAAPHAAVVVSAVVLGGAWFLAILYVFLGFVFVNSAAALDDCGAMEAVRRSWRAARGHRLALVWLLFVTSIAALSGVLLLCVGYLFTISLGTLVPAEAYLALTRGEERKRWWISTGEVGEPDAESAPTGATDAF